MAIVASVTIDDTGNMGISGFPDNLVMALGLLEVAKVGILQQHEANKARVQLAGGPLPPPPANPFKQ